jgi:protein TonB
MEIPQTEQKVTPPPPPPPPTLEVVADEEVIEEDEIASTEVTQETRIEVPVVEMEEEIA